MTKLQVGLCANELGSLTSPDLQDTRSSPKEAATTSTIDKKNSFRAYLEALHTQYAPDYLVYLLTHASTTMWRLDRTLLHCRSCDKSYILKIFKLEFKCELACSSGCPSYCEKNANCSSLHYNVSEMFHFSPKCKNKYYFSLKGAISS